MKQIVTFLPSSLFTVCQCEYINTTVGEIVSPNYPNQYGNYHDCWMRIVVPEGYILTFTYLLFDLEIESSCRYDSFKIYDTDSADG